MGPSTKGVLPGIIVALPGHELTLQRGSPADGRSIINSVFNILGVMHMGNHKQNHKGHDTEISHRVCAPGPVGAEEDQIFIYDI
jgi:hypothetical protein